MLTFKEEQADYLFKIGKYNKARNTYLKVIELYSSIEFNFDEDACHALFQKVSQCCQAEREGRNPFEDRAQNKGAIYM